VSSKTESAESSESNTQAVTQTVTVTVTDTFGPATTTYSLHGRRQSSVLLPVSETYLGVSSITISVASSLPVTIDGLDVSEATR